MAIIIVKTQQIELRGKMPKHVKCSKCGCEYVYLIRRRAYNETAIRTTGMAQLIGDGRQDGKDAAFRQLNKAMIEGVEPVQCPACGWFEPAAIREICMRHARWMIYAGIFAAALLFPLILAYTFYRDAMPEHVGPRRTVITMIVIASALSLGFFLGRIAAIRRINPNAGYPNERPVAKPGAPRTYLKEEYDAARAWDEKKWQVARNGKSTGPYALTEIVEMLRLTQLTLADSIWTEGETEWVQIGRMKGLVDAAKKPARQSIG